MRIIKKGNLKNTQWKIQVVCTGAGNSGSGCKAHLEINQEDIYITSSSCMGEIDTYHTIQCPVCKNETDIEDVPYSLGPFPVKKDWVAEQNKKPPSISLRDVPDFPKKGILFKDISPLLSNPNEFEEFIKYISRQWKGKIDKIGGFDARGFIFASALAYEMKLPFFMLRKKGKLPGKTISVSYGLEYGESVLELCVDAVKKGEKVLLIDDVLATGGTAKAGCELVEKSGGSIAGIQVILEIQALGGRNALQGRKINSLVTS